jgi:hypothetical protein
MALRLADRASAGERGNDLEAQTPRSGRWRLCFQIVASVQRRPPAAVRPATVETFVLIFVAVVSVVTFALTVGSLSVTADVVRFVPRADNQQRNSSILRAFDSSRLPSARPRGVGRRPVRQ